MTICCRAYLDFVKCQPDIRCLITKVDKGSNYESIFDRILIDILRSSLVSLKAKHVDDVPLFLETTLALYSRCRSLGVIALSRPRP